MPSPVGGVDYPRTWSEFVAWFPDEAACVAFLERLRWGDGFVCPGCGSTRSWPASRGLGSRVCAQCAKRTSVTAGTIFAGTRTPLTQWFGAAWNLCATKNGTSALGMQKLLGLGSYETAWTWLHKLRRAMVMPVRDLLRGDVEVLLETQTPQIPRMHEHADAIWILGANRHDTDEREDAHAT